MTLGDARSSIGIPPSTSYFPTPPTRPNTSFPAAHNMSSQVMLLMPDTVTRASPSNRPSVTNYCKAHRDQQSHTLGHHQLIT
jgi:hypothetical protein